MGPAVNAHPVLAHVLFMDIVGCSKLPTDEQKRIVGRLQDLVRASAEFQRARDSDQLISLPTGDGMALAFFNKLDAAVQCAIEITESIQAESLCRIRMGVHTGPVFVMEDINHKQNVSGAGINLAERVMSCGEDGHILVSGNVAESLRHLSSWLPKLRDIGPCQVKDGWVHVWNVVDGPIGNPAIPKKSKAHVLRRRRMIAMAEAALALFVVGAVTAAFWLGGVGKGSPFAKDQASIAVLPFVDLSPQQDQQYFSEGLAEDLLNGLTRIPGLRVAARTSSFQFKTTADTRVIGQKLNVATILEGSVRKQGSRAKIAAQLIKAADGFQLWSATFERETNDIFEVQDEISREVTRALKVTLLLGGKQAKHANYEAYNAYLEGQYFLGRGTKASLEKAIGYFQQAIKLDPSYAAAWRGIGASRVSQAASAYIPFEEGYQQAREAVERALSLDPDLGDAHAALGSIKMIHDWDWAGADICYQRALSLEPANANAIRAAGLLAKNLGHLDKAISLLRRANQLDPLSAGGYHNIATAFYYAGQHEDAKSALGKALELAPDMVNAHGLLGQVYLAESEPQDALSEAKKETHPALRLFGLALANHALGRKQESDANLAELIRLFQADAPYQIAEVYAYRGERERAFEWLDRAYSSRDPGLSEMKGDPLLSSLEPDPRYAALLNKLRLPPPSYV